MPKVQFVDTIENLQADLLILRHQLLQEKLDHQLNRAISYNLKTAKTPVWMTTNGAYHIPKLVIAQEGDDIASLARETTVIVAMQDKNVEKLAFEMVLKKPSAESLIFLCDDVKKTASAFQKYQYLLEGITFGKELSMAPANVMPPEEFAKRCQQLKNQGVHIDVLDEKRLKEVGAEALLAVGRGSVNPPKMVVMEWRGSDEAPIVLVGKGVCFDTGGINIKTSHLVEMKWDKAAAGVVAGVMDTISKMKTPVHVIGIVMLAENMPDGASFKPGDVIPTLGGKSVEIIDTDCEGRLVLADGLAYAQQKFSPAALIDLGTLTLETFGALGSEYAGLFCNDTTLSSALIEAGLATNEKLWPLPLGEYYADQLRSEVADLKNLGVFRYGASSAAAEFLHAFVHPDVSWAHLDISGTAWKIDEPEKGVSGFGIQLLVNFLTHA